MRAAVTLLAVHALVAVLPAREPTREELLVAIEKQLKSVNETAGPSVACVVVSKSDRYPKVPGSDQTGKLGGFDLGEFLKLNREQADQALGRSLDLSDPKTIPDHGFACGVVVDAAGLVLTPYHVVDGATKVYVHLTGRTGSYADIYAADARHDLAVLKLISPPAGMTAVKFADVQLADRPGQRANVFEGKLAVQMAYAYAAGVPLVKPSAALGSLAGIRPAPDVDAKTVKQSVSYYLFGPLLNYAPVYDAKARPGIDGSALLNLDGELIGLTTSTATVTDERGPSCAFPADDNFRRVVDVLRRGEEVEYGYLGVSGPVGVTGANREPLGVRFEDVVPNGPAANALINGSDILTHVNGYPTNSYPELLYRVGSALAGQKVKLRLLRGNRIREAEVTLGKFKNDQPFIASVRPEAVFGLRVEYASVLSQKPQGDARAGAGVPHGVCVRELVANSPAANVFKKFGDRPERWLVTKVNGTEVNTPAEFYQAAKGQTSIKLTLDDLAEPHGRGREVTIP